MIIKRLLAGGLAGMALASGARAAEAIVSAEPEPLEYLRICDGYGNGYFFIPGTETCLRIGGKIRTEFAVHDAYNPGNRDGTLFHTRAELAVDTGTDTEFGPLKTDVVLREEWQENVTTSKLLWANVSIAGFLIGKQDSQYNLYTNYAGNVLNDDVIYDGPKELNQLTYVFDPENGFSALVSLEDSYSSANTSSYHGAWKTGAKDHYLPDVVAGAGYKAGPVSFKVVAGYDSIVEEGAVKARLDVVLDTLTLFLMGGWNTDGDKLNRYAASFQGQDSCPVDRGDLCGWGDWAIWGGATIPISPKLAGNFQIAYTDSKMFEATANMQVKIKDLVITPEITYTSFDSIDKDQLGGIVRFERRF